MPAQLDFFASAAATVVSPSASRTDEPKVLSCPLVKVVTVCESQAPYGTNLSKAEAVADFWRGTVARAEMYDPEKEHFVVIMLNRKNVPKSWNMTSIGTQNSTLVSPREVFRPAVAAAASAIIVAHNHPSGDPSPSAADIRVTRQLNEAAKIMDIEILDHVVIGERCADPLGVGFYSFRQAGLL